MSNLYIIESLAKEISEEIIILSQDIIKLKKLTGIIEKEDIKKKISRLLELKVILEKEEKKLEKEISNGLFDEKYIGHINLVIKRLELEKEQIEKIVKKEKLYIYNNYDNNYIIFLTPINNFILFIKKILSV